MRQRDAERAARRFCVDRYPYYYERWIFDICFEHDTRGNAKSWSFGLEPDQEDVEDYASGSRLTGYVHADGNVEGMY